MCRMGAGTYSCVSPGVGSRCRVVFGSHGCVCGVLPTSRQAWGMLSHGAQHPSRCLAGTAWGQGTQAWEIPPLGAQEEVTPRMLSHAGAVRGTLGAMGLLRSSGTLSLLPPDSWGASARLAEPQNFPKGFSPGMWALGAPHCQVQQSLPGHPLSKHSFQGRTCQHRLGNACGSPWLSPPLAGDTGSCSIYLTVLGELISSICCYFPSPKQGGEQACPCLGTSSEVHQQAHRAEPLQV